MLDPIDRSTAEHLKVVVTGPVLLWLAPFAPPSATERVLGAFHVLATFHRPDAQLIAAGPVDDPAYFRRLQRFAEELNLGSAWLAGDPTAGQLIAFHDRADLELDPATWPAGGAVAIAEAFAQLLDERSGGPVAGVAAVAPASPATSATSGA